MATEQRHLRRAWAVTPGRLAALALFVLAALGAQYLRQCYTPPDEGEPRPELVILQLNDTYRLDPVHDERGREVGGLGRVAALLRDLKARNRNVLVLHAGDFLAPSLESRLLRRGTPPTVAALNYLQEIAPVYVVPGNHEFDEDSPEFLTGALGASRFGWVLSNLERQSPGVSPDLARHASENVVRQFGKVRVGLFALTLDAAHGGRDREYAPIAGDYEAAAEREIVKLEGEGADVIIGLTHLDMQDDVRLARLRQKHPRFVWVAGGHEHYSQMESPSDTSALITKGDSNARTIWKVSVALKDGLPKIREERLTVDDSVKPDERFQRNVAEYFRSRLRQEMPYIDRTVAQAQGVCYNATEETVRGKQSNWGSVIADGMRRAYRNVPADIAVINGGALRIDDNFCNEVRFEHLERSIAFETPVTYVKLSGKNLRKDILEHSVGGKLGDGRFLQVSGVRFRFDRGQRDGERIFDVEVQRGKKWEPLRDDKTYVVAVPSFIFDCGDGYDFRKHVTEYVPQGPDIRALAYEALTVSSGTNQSIAPSPDDRIIGVPRYATTSPVRRAVWTRLNDSDKVCRRGKRETH